MDGTEDGRDWIRRHRRWERRLGELHRRAGVPVPERRLRRPDPFGLLRDLWR